MPEVRIKEKENFDAALRRFKRSCEKAGIMSEVRRREFYEKPTAVRKRKRAAAVKRYQKKLAKEAPQPREVRERRERKQKALMQAIQANLQREHEARNKGGDQ